MTEKFYAFRLSWSVLLLSALIVALTCAPVLFFSGSILVFQIEHPWAAFEPGLLIPFAVTALIFGAFLVMAAYSPKGAVVSPDGITIVKRRSKPVFLPVLQIVSLEPIDRSTLRWSIRTCGCGGFLGSWGYFACKKIGAFRAYATNSDSLVLIRTVSEGPFVLSPENPADFIASAQSFGLCPSGKSQ
jgi:hypothetical protein